MNEVVRDAVAVFILYAWMNSKFDHGIVKK